MSKSYGFIEITGVVAAMDALDIMCKTADVELASWTFRTMVAVLRNAAASD